MYGHESWTKKKAEHRRTDAFELWCWRRLLTVSWMAKRSNQSILKEISPEYSLEGLMLKLKLQYFGHLMWRTDSLEKKPSCRERLKVGGEGDDKGWNGWMPSSTKWTWVWVSSGNWWWTGSQELDMTEQLNWTELDSRRNHETQISINVQDTYNYFFKNFAIFHISFYWLPYSGKFAIPLDMHSPCTKWPPICLIHKVAWSLPP